MLEKIPGSVQEDFGECLQFYINESYVLLKKSKCLLNFGDVSIFAISNETIEISNKII